jgi:peptide/nickel transport system substrate-binding protein
MSDYPAAIVPADFNPKTMLDNQVGTGPYMPESVEVGVKGMIVRNEGHDWWAMRPAKARSLIGSNNINYGTDPSTWVAAAAADEVAMTYETVGEFVSLFEGIGWERSEVASAATIAS